MPRSSTAESSGASTGSGGQLEEQPDYGCTLKLLLPKFSKGYTHKDFVQTLIPHICRSEIENIGRGKYPNEWMVTLSSQSATYKLLRKGVITVQQKKCVILPYEENKVCGRIHWLPADVLDTSILVILQRFGDVCIMEKEKMPDETHPIETTVRFFIMNLKDNITKEMIPHFIKVAKSEGLLTIKGRHPMCFRCKGDHRKFQCTMRNTKFLPRAPAKKKGKPLKKSKDADASVDATANPKSGAAANASQARARKEPNQSASGASGSRSASAATTLSKPSEHVPAVDPNNLQNFVNFLGQTLAALNMNTNQGAAAAPGAAATDASDLTTDEAKKTKKKKKKNKKKESYDVTEGSNTAAAPAAAPAPVSAPAAAPVSAPATAPAPVVNQVTVREKPVSITPQVPVSVNVGVSPAVTTAASGDTVAQKKKKNKKKKKPSNSSNI